MNYKKKLEKLSKIFIPPQHELVLIHLLFQPSGPTILATKLGRTSQYYSCKILPHLSKLGLIKKEGVSFFLTDLGIGYLLLRYTIDFDKHEIPKGIKPKII